jgi:hypothetical protein
MRQRLLLPLIFALTALVCSNCNPKPRVNAQAYQPLVADAEMLRDAVDALTGVIVHDIFSPPVASRIYAYSTVAAYEVIRQTDPSFPSLAGRVNGLTLPPQADTTQPVLIELAATFAFLETGKAMIFSEPDIKAYEDTLIAQLKRKGMPQEVIDASLAYGVEMKKHVLSWADGDNYKQTRTSQQYSVTDDPSKWVPTPPAYIQAIEPAWGKIRPFVLDSAQQFKPAPPTPWDAKKGSPFWKLAEEVFTIGNTLTEEQRAIASFWDCNPYVMHQQGHVMFATKKITPGGHWMGIACQISRNKGLNWVETADVVVHTALALADGFISCWDEKYRSSLLRPETYINQHMDPNWLPLLQTPPFPEHTSGHSVISSAAAVVLTSILGDSVAFADSVEVLYGLPVRSFTSFYQAADEASVSRIYGGIHYRPAVEEGIIQGKAVGNLLVEKLRKGQPTYGVNP